MGQKKQKWLFCVVPDEFSGGVGEAGDLFVILIAALWGNILEALLLRPMFSVAQMPLSTDGRGVARLAQLLRDVGEVMGKDRKVCVAFDLTLPTEEIFRGTAGQLTAEFLRSGKKGEFVLVIGPAAR